MSKHVTRHLNYENIYKKENGRDTLEEMLNAAIRYNTSPNFLTTVVILSSRKY